MSDNLALRKDTPHPGPSHRPHAFFTEGGVALSGRGPPHVQGAYISRGRREPVKTTGVRSVISLLAITLVLFAGLAPSLARCASSPQHGGVEPGAGGMGSHSAMAGHAAAAASASDQGGASADTSPASDTNCCITMMSCSPPVAAGSSPLRVRTIGFLPVARPWVTPLHSSLRSAPESPPPKV